jgi:cell shape-determining protein MreD
MRWPIFVVFAFVALALEISLRNSLRLDNLYHGVSPSFVACLLTFILMFAPRLTSLWACWIIGVVMDLLPGQGETAVRVIGPCALGLVFGGLMIIPLRSMVFRRRLLTMAFMTFVFALASSIVSVFLLTLRHWYPSSSTADYSGLRDLTFRFFEALYSGVLAIPVGWLLLLTLPLWGFQTNAPRRSAWW